MSDVLPSVISKESLKARVTRLQELAEAGDMCGVVVHAAPADLGHASQTSGNVRYLSGWGDSSFPSVLVVPRSGEPVLLVLGVPLDARWWSENSWIEDIRVMHSAEDLGIGARRIVDEFAVEGERVGVIGRSEMFVATARPIFESASYTFEDADDLLGSLKIARSEAEVDLQRIGASVSDAMIARAFEIAGNRDATGAKVLAGMKHEGAKRGADYVASWVAWGSAPTFVAKHVSQGSERIGPTDRVQVGTYVTYGGCWSHGIRMATRGPAAAKLRDAWSRVCEIQDAGFDALRPGRPLRDVVSAMQECARTHVRALDCEDGMTIRFGHALGAQYAEPVVSDAFPGAGITGEPGGDEVILSPGMVFELHPNFTVPNLGWIVTGDMAAVTESGADWLTLAPRELVAV